MGAILCFKTRKHWHSFQRTHHCAFAEETVIDWQTLQSESSLDTIIALKDAHIDNTTNESLTLRHTKHSNEILIRTKDSQCESFTSDSMNGHSLILRESDYTQWIAHMRKMARVEQRAIAFRHQSLLLRKQRKKNKNGNKPQRSGSEKQRHKNYSKQSWLHCLALVIGCMTHICKCWKRRDKTENICKCLSWLE